MPQPYVSKRPRLDPYANMDPRLLEHLKRQRPQAYDEGLGDNAMIGALAQASAAMGTLGGKQANAQPVVDHGKRLDAQRFAAQDRGEAQGDRLAQYMASVRAKNQARDQGLDDQEQNFEKQKELARYKQVLSNSALGAKSRAKMEDYNRKRQDSLEDKKKLEQYKHNIKEGLPGEGLPGQVAPEGMPLSQVTPGEQPHRRVYPTTKTQKKMDEKYLPEHLEFTSIGKENAANSINKLEGYLDYLKQQKGAFVQAGGGPITGSLMPDFMRTEDSIKLRDDIAGVAMLGLKDIFTGAISNAEREALAATFYNDKIGPDQNISILERKIAGMKRAYQNRLDRANYFERNGESLAGFSGLSPADELASIREKDPIFEPPKHEPPSDTAYAGELKVAEPQPDKYGFKKDEVKTANGKEWKYMGNNIWQEQ